MSYCGFDFGTSNSAVGVVKNEAVTMVPLESESRLIRTAIFIDDEEKEIFYGDRAIHAYLDGCDGRLMRSIKSVLGTSLIDKKTNIFNKMVPFSSIIGLFIAEMKQRAEKQCNHEIESVVLGRPVRFNDDDDEMDMQAENILREIAHEKGFKNVEFQLDPVAAAKAFQFSHPLQGNLLVVDIGGGTSDFTILMPNSDDSVAGYRVLGTSGIHIGGTNLDKALALKKIMPELGMGTQVRIANGTDINIPSTWFHNLSTWHEINSLYPSVVIGEIQNFLATSLDKKRTKRLIDVLTHKRGHQILEDAENCKKRLSDAMETEILLNEIESGLTVGVTKRELETIIDPDIASVRDKISELIRNCGLTHESIDFVFYTGGTTMIPSVQHTINNLFPNSKMLTGDMLHSVGIGLTLDAKERFS